MQEHEIKLAFFDIDGTLYRDNVTLRLIQVLREQKKISGPECQALDDAMSEFRRRHIAYDVIENIVAELMEKSFEGLYLDDLLSAGRHAAQISHERPYLFTHTLLRCAREVYPQIKCIAISGSPIAVVEPYALELGFDHVVATLFELDEKNRVTGGWGKSTSPYGNKGAWCHEYAEKYHVEHDQGVIHGALAVGDSIADYSMFRVVEFPIAFNPTHELDLTCRMNAMPVVTERRDVVRIMYSDHFAKPRYTFTEVDIESIVPSALAKAIRARMPNLYLPL